METFERLLHWVVWCGSCIYSLWVFSRASASNYPLLYSEDFQDGWALLNSKKDKSDHEWAFFKKAFQIHWPWLFGQLFLSQMFFRRWHKWLPLFYTVCSLLFFISTMGVISTLIYTSLIFLMYAIHKTASRTLCYSAGILMLYSMNSHSYVYLRKFAVQDEFSSFLFDIGFGWLIARCISFSIDRINNRTFQLSSLEDICGILAYCFYQPALFSGPLITYDLFALQMAAPNKKWTVQRAHLLFIQFFRYLFCFILLEFLLHFLYSSAMQFYPVLTYALDGWTLCGLGYSLPLLFYLKYRVIYGVAVLFAEIEGFTFPPAPKCISRIHLSSFQWRYFDRGLHLWLAKYISQPITQFGRRNLYLKVFSVFLCFSFVCMWHGMGKAVCVWSTLSFFGVILESIASQVASSRNVQQISENWPLCYKRIQAFFGAMSFMMMCISCIFFLSNMEVGMLFVHRIIFGFPIPFITTFFVLYCGSHVSMDVTKWDDNYDKSKKSQDSSSTKNIVK